MNSVEIATYLRSMVDDPDLTFVSNVELAMMLQAGYSSFRRVVLNNSSSYYEQGYDFLAPNSYTVDLNNLFLGQTPTQPRLEKIVRLHAIDAVPMTMRGRIFRPAASLENLMSNTTFGDTSWWLQNRKITFSNQLAVPFHMDYIPADTTVWTTAVTTPTFIDDLVASEWGDLVALLAIQSYKIKDFAQNPMHDALLNQRMQDFKAFLNHGRSGDASRFVQAEDDAGISGW